MRTRSLHTADFQIGKPFGRVPDPQNRSVARKERFRALEAIACQWHTSERLCLRNGEAAGCETLPVFGARDQQTILVGNALLLLPHHKHLALPTFDLAPTGLCPVARIAAQLIFSMT